MLFGVYTSFVDNKNSRIATGIYIYTCHKPPALIIHLHFGAPFPRGKHPMLVRNRRNDIKPLWEKPKKPRGNSIIASPRAIIADIETHNVQSFSASTPNLLSKNLNTPMTLAASTSYAVLWRPPGTVAKCGIQVLSSSLAFSNAG